MLSKIFLLASMLIVCALASKRNKIVKASYNDHWSTKQCTRVTGQGYDLLSSHNYPNKYNNADLTCHYSIDNPDLKTIVIEFLNLGTDDRMSCDRWGELVIYHWDGYSETPIYRFYGTGDKRFEFSSLRNDVHIKYVNPQTSCKGFQLAFWLVSSGTVGQLTTERYPHDLTAKQCTVEQGNGYSLLSSQHFPNNYNYYTNLTCHFLIENPELKTIFIEIIDFDFDERSCRGLGRLMFYEVKINSDGFFYSQRQIGDFNYGSQNKQFQYSSRNIHIEYLNHQSSCKGFRLKYWFGTPSIGNPGGTLTTKLCEVERYPDFTVLSSANYPNKQSNVNLTCHYPIDNSQSKTVFLEFFDLDIHKPECGGGKLLIYEMHSNPYGVGRSGETLLASYNYCFHDVLEYPKKHIRIEFQNYQSSCKGLKMRYYFRD